MVGVAQLAEHRTVVAKVAGSSPVIHPKERLNLQDQPFFFYLNLSSNKHKKPSFVR